MNFKELPVALIYEVPNKPASQATLFEAANLLRVNGYKVRFSSPALYEKIYRDKADLVILFDKITSNAEEIKADHQQDGARILVLPLDTSADLLPELIFIEQEQPKKAKGRRKQSTISDEERE